MFADDHLIPAWGRQALDWATRLRIMVGYRDGTFRPFDQITRIEHCVSLYMADFDARIQARLPDILPCVVKISTPVSLGSGTIISGDGIVLTNRHCVEKDGVTYKEFRVSSGPWQGEVVGTLHKVCAFADLALIKVAAPVDRYIKLGSDIRIGDGVAVIGMPLGEEDVVQPGIVGDFKGVGNDIHTSAHINPGNSGGLLCNRHGELVGVPTYKYLNAEAMGYCIHVDVVKKFLQYSGVNA